MSSQFSALVDAELAEARENFPAVRSIHEGYAIALEEFEELWDEIKMRPSLRSKERILKEAVQAAAMIRRLAEDCGLLTQACPETEQAVARMLEEGCPHGD